MEYRRLGQTGLRVSTLGLGSWVTFGAKGGQYGVDTAVALMGQAYEAGVNFCESWMGRRTAGRGECGRRVGAAPRRRAAFCRAGGPEGGLTDAPPPTPSVDNAETYADGEAEAVMGDALARLAWRRSSYVLTTKIFFGATYGRGEKEGSVKGPNETGLSRKHIFEGLAASLARLRVSYVDVVFAHRPDADTPLWETVRAFSDAVDRGLALYWGTSEWTRADIEKARALADKHGLHPPVGEEGSEREEEAGRGGAGASARRPRPRARLQRARRDATRPHEPRTRARTPPPPSPLSSQQVCEQPEYNLMARARVEVEYGPLYGAEPGLGLTT